MLTVHTVKVTDSVNVNCCKMLCLSHDFFYLLELFLSSEVRALEAKYASTFMND